MKVFHGLTMEQIRHSDLAKTTGLVAVYEWLANETQSRDTDLYEVAQAALAERVYLIELGITVPYTPDGRLLLLGSVIRKLDGESEVAWLHELGSLRQSFRKLARSKYPALQYGLRKEEIEDRQAEDELRASGFDIG